MARQNAVRFPEIHGQRRFQDGQLPQDATREDVANVYMMAYEEGLKGITIYRDGSREGQVLTTGKEKKAEVTPVAAASPVLPTPRKRAKVTHGITEKVTTGCGSIYVTVNSDEQGICEVFTTSGQSRRLRFRPARSYQPSDFAGPPVRSGC